MEPPKDYAEEAQEPDNSGPCLVVYAVATAWGVAVGWLLHWMWVALAG